MAKKPKPPFNKNLITVEDAAVATAERGWRIAEGKTPRLVDVHTSPVPHDAATAIAACAGKQLPCTCHLLPSGQVDRIHEGSYDI